MSLAKGQKEPATSRASNVEVDSYLSLEVTAALADTLIVALVETLSQRP